MENHAATLPPSLVGQSERRTNIIIEGRPLLCFERDDAGALVFPQAYIDAAVGEALAALQGVKGCNAALLTVTLKLEPYATILADLPPA